MPDNTNDKITSMSDTIHFHSLKTIMIIFILDLLSGCATLNGSKTSPAALIEIFSKREIENVQVMFSNNPWYRKRNSVPFMGKHRSNEISSEAGKYLGIPYKFGGAHPREGFDCSGLVQFVFSKFGKKLPHSTREQYKIGFNVLPQRAKAGDLLFFDINGKGISHVGIYMGKMRFIHAPHKNSRVKMVYLMTDYWKKRFRGIKRIMI